MRKYPINRALVDEPPYETGSRRLEKMGSVKKRTAKKIHNGIEKVKNGDPAVHAILTDPKYKLPRVLPNGKYKAKTFKVEPLKFKLTGKERV